MIVKQAIIKKLPNGKYRVESHKGKSLGEYSSKEKAEQRLKQVEMFKHMKKKKAEESLRDLAKTIDNKNILEKICYALSVLSGSKSPKPHLTYSHVMRELRKNAPKEEMRKFQIEFKKSFDEALYEGLENPEDVALMAALQVIDIEIE